MRGAPILLAGGLLAACTASSRPEEAAQPPRPIAAAAAAAAAPAGPILYAPKRQGPKPPLDLTSAAEAGEVKLVNGQTVAEPAAWRAVAQTTSDTQVNCTVTLIGPQVILTAAHCIDAERPDTAPGVGDPTTVGGRITLQGKPPIALTGCAMHPRYGQASLPGVRTPRSSYDYGLCELKSPVKDVVLETLDTGPPLASPAKVLLSGAGCTQIGVVANQITFVWEFGTLRIGDERVEATSVSGDFQSPGAYVRTRADGNDPIVCPGDSGGPVFRGASVGEQAPNGRRVVAVNSMVAALPEGVGYRYYSLFSPVNTPEFRQFLSQWSGGKATRKVCGVDPGVANCRP